MQNRNPLLARLARESWFTQMGEPAATKCLALMLQAEPRLQQATLRWLSDLTGVDLGSVHHFEAEVVHDDGGRADLEGMDSQGRPVLMVEAKFGAVLTEGQLVSYLLDQQMRLDGGPGVLVVLVPEARMDHAESVLKSAKTLVDSESVPAAVVSWDAWMDSWDNVIDEDSTEDFLLRSDVSQLRGLVRTLGGLLGQPYAPNPDVPWIQWEQDLVALVSEFTREVNEGQGHSARDLPIQSRNTEFAPARYVLAARRPSKDVFLVVGLSRDRAGLGKTPIWAMLSQQYAAPVLGALHAHFPEGEEDQHGHFWIPLKLPATVGRERVRFMADSLRDLMAQLQSLY
jgi:hypothetical protein